MENFIAASVGAIATSIVLYVVKVLIDRKLSKGIFIDPRRMK